MVTKRMISATETQNNFLCRSSANASDHSDRDFSDSGSSGWIGASTPPPASVAIGATAWFSMSVMGDPRVQVAVENIDQQVHQ